MNIRSWEKIPLELADVFLPDEPGVYIVMSAKAGSNRGQNFTRPIYVGCSQNLRKRWADGHHKLLACLREGGREIRYVVSDDYKAEEAALIAKLTPILNDRP
jgi:excinuclease UvrABC nuclease subunit